jgi:hypothetical protein
MHIEPRHIRRAGLAVAALLVILVITLPVTLPAPLHDRLERAIGERFGGTVELSSLRVSVFPRLGIAGDGVVVRHEGRTDVPPLIAIDSFSAEAGLFGLLGRPIRLSRVHLNGLEVNVPSGGLDIDGRDDEADGNEDDSRAAATGDSGASPEPSSRGANPEPSPLIVDDLVSEDAVLRILRSTPDKAPREWAIARLSMQDTGANTPWAFEASLTNPTPPGRIEVQGTFGPWIADEPSQTPLDADYEFQDADLGHFKGIRGTLQSSGAFEGVLERIEVEGTTDVPDFALADVGQPVHLKTTFHSIVDGTNGNTLLQPVVATFGRTTVHADGGVVEDEGEDGRVVRLDVVMDQARIEDVLRLAVRTDEPPMTGALMLRATFELPPGDVHPMQKLRLDGTFEIAEARFGEGGVQDKVNELSQKAQGGEDAAPASDVVSDFGGSFVMRGGVIRFSTITFALPGARVDLNGAYTLETEALDFRGTVRLDARLSELTSGAKSFLLRLVEPIFRRGNVTVVPITIGGTAHEPKFGLDVGRAFTPG